MELAGVLTASSKPLSNPYVDNNPFRFRHHKGKERSPRFKALVPRLMALSHFITSRDKPIKTRNEASSSPAKPAAPPAGNVSENGTIGKKQARNSHGQPNTDHSVKKRFGRSKVNPKPENDIEKQDDQKLLANGEIKAETHNGNTTAGSSNSIKDDKKQISISNANGVMKKTKSNGVPRAKGPIKVQNANGGKPVVVYDTGVDSENKSADESMSKSHENNVVTLINDIQPENESTKVIDLGGSKRIVKGLPVDNRSTGPASNQQGAKGCKQNIASDDKPKGKRETRKKEAPVTNMSRRSQGKQKTPVSKIFLAKNSFQKSLAERIMEKHAQTGFVVDTIGDRRGSKTTLESNVRKPGDSVCKSLDDNDNENGKSTEALEGIPNGGEGINTGVLIMVGSEETSLRKHCPDLTPVEGENSSPIVRGKRGRRAFDI